MTEKNVLKSASRVGKVLETKPLFNNDMLSDNFMRFGEAGSLEKLLISGLSLPSDEMGRSECIHMKYERLPLT
ncbi:hypothetical protein PanWU01x14_324920 [Parasponia andersonii]|uniref:Uncharacterized protein n=1 Tax=Parasponia andersonii TaxID=3476 RepID=A0A2P5AK19_PARAD|nr:hypothetical protein PanWU01x14_324920 [Parasponia andersonii]